MTCRTSNVRGWAAVVVAGIGWFSQTGCAPNAQIRIVQPGLPPPQDVVRLRSHWAYASDDAGSPERIVLMFPLPGARAGDRQYFVYLRVPGKRSNPFAIGEPIPGGGHVGGFLIQAKGELAGKTVFKQGRIELHGLPFDGGRRRQGKLTLHGEDGSTIEGEFIAVLSPLEVRDFEDAKAGDVRALLREDRLETDRPPSGQAGRGHPDTTGAAGHGEPR